MSSPESFNFGHSRGNELVAVTIGEEKPKFTLHKQLLCESVAYFRSAFVPSGFKESHKFCIDLPEDDPKTFELFAHWLYRASIPAIANDVDFNHIFNLYSFAEKLCINKLANKILDALHDREYDDENFLTILIKQVGKI